MPFIFSALSRISAVVLIGLAVTFSAVYEADARRGGGGFGSRGTRTFQAPAPTRTAPNNAAPIERSMSPRPQNQQTTAQPQAAQQRPGLFGGMGRSLLGGLLVGGLIGAMLGHGFGGIAGLFGMLIQIALIAGLAMLALRFFRSRQPATATAGGQGFGRDGFARRDMAGDTNNQASPLRVPTIGSGQPQSGQKPGFAGGQSAAPSQGGDEIGLTQADLDRFEQLLTEVQTAYGKEDYATLRRLTTPEAMSYLAEELGQNATDGLRNSVSDVKLLQADIAEAWAEGAQEYATTAMRYSSIDAMLDRTTGRVVQGDEGEPSQTTEVWTFVRENGSEWKLAAIQDAA
ncbi:Tim44 domain-containing protein [Phyllobacterium sp. 21LDTY02-6]|uniref:Tim44 domain-containing protein n=1 Tax=unclassified Phyllobacterium TaxID=2638441 RepID=UPI002021DDC1|nr:MULTISPECIES: Tim44 domain-containing protein [unclassified Phyllobacterium]MCO4315739.1 Tim44 domain-containing protein [Phyllobacterium sp. 21LDTY02-6]MCX8280849.1 Tim44 domain-containing protein [Phyllobacterium sp. 0TCS1.6C]MCX8295715.1 Tim44 domain-containing protein [Phyllobacterium sp. 0TCS1.6A]